MRNIEVVDIKIASKDAISLSIEEAKENLLSFLNSHIPTTQRNFLNSKTELILDKDTILISLSSEGQAISDYFKTIKGVDPFKEYRELTFQNLAKKWNSQ